jgi:hypothetical protein
MKKIKLVALLLCVMLTSCNAIKTAVYDQYSYQQTTSIKVDASRLIDKSTDQYSKNVADVQKLLLDMDKMMEYEKNKPNNEITFAMWQVLTNKEKNSVAGFFKRWEEKGSFSPIFLEESKKQLMEGFDLLIQYEVRKDQQSKDNLLNLINK